MSAAIPVADMCSGTGERPAALQATIQAPTALTSLSDTDPGSRTYLQDRFPTAITYADCRDQNIPDAAAVTIGAPAPPHRDDHGRPHPAFTEWMMGLPQRKHSRGQHGSGSPATRL